VFEKGQPSHKILIQRLSIKSRQYFFTRIFFTAHKTRMKLAVAFYFRISRSAISSDPMFHSLNLLKCDQAAQRPDIILDTSEVNFLSSF
jgi:hypothetical protein